MRSDRPGYQYRKNKDGSVAHYWNPARLRKYTTGGLPPIVRFRDGMSDDQIAQECRRLSSELKEGRSYVDVLGRKRRNISEHLYRMYQKRARDIGKPFNLSADWIHDSLRRLGDKCEISGIAFNYDPQPRKTKSHFKHPIRPSLDRIDNTGGYVPGNVRFVLHCVNIGINEWGLDNYIAVCAAVASHQRGDFPDLTGQAGRLLVSTDG